MIFALSLYFSVLRRRKNWVFFFFRIRINRVFCFSNKEKLGFLSFEQGKIGFSVFRIRKIGFPVFRIRKNRVFCLSNKNKQEKIKMIIRNKTFCCQKMDFLSIGQKDAQWSVSPLWVRIKRVWALRMCFTTVFGCSLIRLTEVWIS